MSRHFHLATAALALVACAPKASPVPDSSAAGTGAAESTTASAAASTTAPAAESSPTAAVVVLYNQPKDTAAFEKYYADKHLPLVGQHQSEIGFTRAVLTKFDASADGKKPPYYRKAELWFPSEEALTKGMATPGFKAVGGDFANFVTNGGPIVLISHETNK